MSDSDCSTQDEQTNDPNKDENEKSDTTSDSERSQTTSDSERDLDTNDTDFTDLTKKTNGTLPTNDRKTHPSATRKRKTDRHSRQKALDMYFKSRNELRQHKVHAHDPTTTIPTPTISTYNITSLSAYAKPGDQSYHRSRRVIEDIRTLAEKSDIIMLQETKLDAYGKHSALESTLPSWTFIYNNNPDNEDDPATHTAGTMVGLSPNVTNNYDVSIDGTKQLLKGRAQSIKLTKLH